MNRFDDLASYAARCDRLAQACSDPLIAERLRRLAQDHRDLAREQLDRSSSSRSKEESLPAIPL
jgi:hypothetical protein